MIGPLVFPAVGVLDKDEAIAIPHLASASPASWLVSVPGERLHFSVKGLPPSAVTFKPFLGINGTETFTAFPLFKTDDDALVDAPVLPMMRVALRSPLGR
jgi:hypothetical protein